MQYEYGRILSAQTLLLSGLFEGFVPIDTIGRCQGLFKKGRRWRTEVYNVWNSLVPVALMESVRAHFWALKEAFETPQGARAAFGDMQTGLVAMLQMLLKAGTYLPMVHRLVRTSFYETVRHDPWTADPRALQMPHLRALLAGSTLADLLPCAESPLPSAEAGSGHDENLLVLEAPYNRPVSESALLPRGALQEESTSRTGLSESRGNRLPKRCW